MVELVLRLTKALGLIPAKERKGRRREEREGKGGKKVGGFNEYF